LLRDFLGQTCDALARAWTSGPLRGDASWTGSDPGLRWARALFGPPRPIAGSEAQAESLQRSHHLWLRNLRVAGDEYFRVALRLSAPEREGEPWLLDFLLQAQDDPSLLVGGGDIWRAGEASLGLRRLTEPREKLLAGLGYAARYFGPLERALEGSNPSEVKLSAEEAFRFLRDCAPLLEESGFGVLVPPWWSRSGARLGLRAHVSPKSSDGVAQGMMGLEGLLNYRWELALGGERLSKEEFETLIAHKSPLVRFRGEWVRLDPEQVEAAVRFFSRQETESEISVLDALRLGTGGVEEAEGLAVEEVDFEGGLAE
jgi:hypothetical protein